MGGDQYEPFPWDIGIFDAHCHPTDTMASISKIPEMKARTLTVMSTRSQDQDLVVDVTSRLKPYSGPKDSDATHKIVPSFGWHPWFSYQLYDDTENSHETPPTSSEHYSEVLQPSCTDQEFIDTLPQPRSLSKFLQETESRLLSHPTALIGEVGLDRSFRLPVAWTESEKQQRNDGYTEGTREGRQLSPYRVTLSHQKAILKAQLRLAGKHNRAVSIHSVQSHGAILEVLEELWKGHEKPVLSKRERKKRRDDDVAANNGNTTTDRQDHSKEPKCPQSPSLPYPPRICLHSYSGPPEPLHQFLQPSHPSLIFFSFSHLINFTSSAQPGKAEAVIRALPPDRILVESDYHAAGEEVDGWLEEVVRTVCRVKGWGVREGVERLRGNWWRWAFGWEEGSGPVME